MAVSQKLHCQVERILDHGEHVYTVDLKPERQLPRFKAGQFMHLALDTYDPSGYWPESRVFSIASSPQQRDQLRISYSVQGRFTARMENELTEGGQVWVKLPYGDFLIEDHSDIVLFAGGTGITAFTAFLEGLDSSFQHRVYLAYGVRRKNLLLYQQMIEKRAQGQSNLTCFYFVEQLSDNDNPHLYKDQSDTQIYDPFALSHGRLSVDKIWSKIESPSNAIYYISGPPQMIKTLSQELIEQRIKPASIRIDAWE